MRHASFRPIRFWPLEPTFCTLSVGRASNIVGGRGSEKNQDRSSFLGGVRNPLDTIPVGLLEVTPGSRGVCSDLRTASLLETPLFAGSTISVRKSREKLSCTMVAAGALSAQGAVGRGAARGCRWRSSMRRADKAGQILWRTAGTGASATAGDGRAKDEGGARLRSPARLDTLSVMCCLTYFSTYFTE